MANTKAPSTMAEALQSTLGDISMAMAAPDADIPFLRNLQAVIVGKLHQPNQHQQQQGRPGGHPVSGGGMPGQGQPGPAPSPTGLSMPGASAGGMAANPSLPNLQAPHGGVSSGLSPSPEEMRALVMQLAGGPNAEG